MHKNNCAAFHFVCERVVQYYISRVVCLVASQTLMHGNPQRRHEGYMFHTEGCMFDQTFDPLAQCRHTKYVYMHS